MGAFMIVFILILISFSIAVGLANYLLFHTVIELFSILIAFGITIIAINKVAKNYTGKMLLFLGIAYSFVGFFDLLHVMTYKGMGIFSNNSANLPTQLWVTARLFESISFLFAFYYLKKPLNIKKVIISYTSISILILASIFNGYFPDAYIEGRGLTTFKIFSELIVISIMLKVFFMLRKRRKKLGIQTYKFLMNATVTTIIAELCFSVYIDVYGFFNMTGHIFKAISFYFVYKAIVEKSIKDPYFKLKNISNKLSLANKKNKIILNSVSDIFYTVDESWNFIYANKTAKDILGDNLLGRSLWEIIPVESDCHNKFHHAKLNNEVTNFDTYSDELGKWFNIIAYPFDKGLTITFRDISERKQFEKEMVKLEQFEVIGQLAASIAHEIRNPLTTVRGFIQLMQQKMQNEHYSIQFNLIIDELDRANEIITEYLSLAKTEEINFKKQNLNTIIKAIYPLIYSDALRDNKDVKLDLEEIPDIVLDEKQIKQIIINLCRNGLEAMSCNGQLKIKTNKTDNGVRLSISDQGRGIPKEVLHKIGQPFFTTKKTGTGLGLAICNKFINNHNAKMNIDTSSLGTTFSIDFI